MKPQRRASSSGQLPAVRLVRKLELAAGAAAGRPAWLSAASGLICAADEFYVVADDELHLGRFPAQSGEPGRLQRLFAGELPTRRKPRKKRKPDLEVLMRLPASAEFPHGALLALGSGSNARRCRGALLALDARGHVSGRPRSIDAAPLFARLSQDIAGLNLEGGWVSGDHLHLLQRGNKGDGRNALLRWDLKPMLRGLLRDRVLPDVDPVDMRGFDLGEVQGVPLGFTDASPLPGGGWLFSAVAENTGNAHDDGACLGSVIGRMDARSRLRWIRRVPGRHKIEGVDVQQGSRLQVWMVTDADDPGVPASLLQWED